MAKKPEFKLYRICNRENGKAYQGHATAMQPLWSNLGAFYRTPETIRKHLRELTSRYEWKEYEDRKHGGRFVRMAEIPDEYKKFYVECYSVLQLEVKTQEAAEYLGIGLRATA